MWPFNLKFYIYAALFVAAIGFFMRYDYVTDQNKILKADVEQYRKNEETAKKQIEDADKARTDYLNKLQVAQNEIDTLRNGVNAGTTGLHVKATCPKSPAITDYTTRTETTSPELDRDAEQDYYAILQGIKTVEARYALCVKTLEDERK